MYMFNRYGVFRKVTSSCYWDALVVDSVTQLRRFVYLSYCNEVMRMVLV
jgi:hypothetical protein